MTNEFPFPSFNEEPQGENQVEQTNSQPSQFPSIESQPVTPTQPQMNFPQVTQQPVTPNTQPSNQFPATQQQPVNQPNNQQQNTKSNQQWIQRPKYTFYTGSSALSISYGEQCIFWETAPALGPKKFDWQNGRILVKMGAEEIDNILTCLNAYSTGGIQAFQQMAQFLKRLGKILILNKQNTANINSYSKQYLFGNG
jgi:hypothetical protein